MCRVVLYDYTPCGHQSGPSLQRCQPAVERNIAICSDVNEEDQPEVIIPLEQSCPSCSQGLSHDPEERILHDYDQPGHLQGDEEDLDQLALQTALEASKLDVREEDVREVIEASELEAEEYERRTLEEVLRASFEEMPGTVVWREQNDLLRRTRRGGWGWGQGEGMGEADSETDDFATRLGRLKGQSVTARGSQGTIQAVSKRSVCPSTVEQSRPAAFPSNPGSRIEREITSAAPSTTSDISSLLQGRQGTLRSMTDRRPVSSRGTAVPAPQNILRGPRKPPSPPRSPMEAAEDLEREEELRRVKYERMKSGSDQDGGGSVIGGDRMPGFEDLPIGDAQRSVISDNVDEDEDDGSGSGETETIRRLESRSSGSRFSRRPF